MRGDPTPEIWVETRGPLTVAALVAGRELVGLEADHADCLPRAGARYAARVTRLLPQMGGVDVQWKPHAPPAYMKGRGLEAGARVVVEWVAPPKGEKKAIVRHLKEDAPSGIGAPSLLQDGPDALTRLLTRVPSFSLPSDPLIRRENFDLIGLDGAIDSLTARTVPLGHDGHLVFDPTEAAHVIDVNGKGREVNHRAMAEVARQLHLRNLSGTILIDLVGDRRKLQPGLCDTLREATRTDPCRVEVYGITALGLMELTRERRGWELASLLRDPPG